MLAVGIVLGGCARMNDDIARFTPEITGTDAVSTSYSILLKANVTRADGISEYGFCYGEGVADKRLPADNLADGQFSVNIAGLKPETEYLFYAYISNGISEITSTPQVITTMKEPLPDDRIEIPDPVFRNYILWNFDSDKDGFLSYAEAQKIKKIDIVSDELESLEGMQNFRNLEQVNASGVPNGGDGLSNGKLTRIDLSGNPNLRRLDLDYQNIIELDLSANLNLVHVGLYKSPIRRLDISANVNLVVFGTGHCQLDSVDLSNNPKLEEVHLDRNRLQKIKVGDNDRMWYLDVSGNILDKLDVSGCPHLQELHCRDNALLDTIFIKTGQTFKVFNHDDSVKIVTKD